MMGVPVIRRLLRSLAGLRAWKVLVWGQSRNVGESQHPSSTLGRSTADDMLAWMRHEGMELSSWQEWYVRKLFEENPPDVRSLHTRTTLP